MITTNFVVTTNIVIVTNYVVLTNAIVTTNIAGTAVQPTREQNVFGVLWWSEGLNYRLTQRIELGRTNELGIPIVNENISMTGRLGIKGAFDAAAFASARGQ